MRVEVLSRLLLSGLFLTLFGLVFSVIWALVFHFESSTYTHCNVYNFLPSVSGAIASSNTPRCVYTLCICLASGTYFLDALCCYRWHMSIHMGLNNKLYKRLVKFTVTSHVMEKLGLVTLSMVSSTDNFDVHKSSFAVFIVSSLVFMTLECSITYWTHISGLCKATQQNKKNLRIKLAIFTTYLTVIMGCTYLYSRHNSQCEPYVYSYLALFEYLTILSNIVFHGTCMLRDYNHYSFGDLSDTYSITHVHQNHNNNIVDRIDTVKIF